MSLSKRILLINIIIVLFIAELWIGFLVQSRTVYDLTHQIIQLQTTLERIKQISLREKAETNKFIPMVQTSSFLRLKELYFRQLENIMIKKTNKWMSDSINNLDLHGSELLKLFEQYQEVEQKIYFEMTDNLNIHNDIGHLNTKINNILLDSKDILTQDEYIYLTELSLQYYKLTLITGHNTTEIKNHIHNTINNIALINNKIKTSNNASLNKIIDENNTKIQEFENIRKSENNFIGYYNFFYQKSENLINESKKSIILLEKYQDKYFITICSVSLGYILLAIITSIFYISRKNIIPLKESWIAIFIFSICFTIWSIQASNFIKHEKNISKYYSILNTAILFEGNAYASNIETTMQLGAEFNNILYTLKNNQADYKSLQKISDTINNFLHQNHLINDFRKDTKNIEQVNTEILNESLSLLNNMTYNSSYEQKNIEFLKNLYQFHIISRSFLNYSYYFYCCKDDTHDDITLRFDNLLLIYERNQKYLLSSSEETISNTNYLSLYAMNALFKQEILPLVTKYRVNQNMIKVKDSLLSLNSDISLFEKQLKYKQHNQITPFHLYINIAAMLIFLLLLLIWRWYQERHLSTTN